jgi:hypothetical protein
MVRHNWRPEGKRRLRLPNQSPRPPRRPVLSLLLLQRLLLPPTFLRPHCLLLLVVNSFPPPPLTLLPLPLVPLLTLLTLCLPRLFVLPLLPQCLWRWCAVDPTAASCVPSDMISALQGCTYSTPEACGRLVCRSTLSILCRLWLACAPDVTYPSRHRGRLERIT